MPEDSVSLKIPIVSIKLPAITSEVTDDQLVSMLNTWWNEVGESAFVDYCRHNGMIVLDQSHEIEAEVDEGQEKHNNFFDHA